MPRAASHDLKTRIDSLTPAQMECLLLAARHFGSKQIAEQLSISPKTVDNRISKALATLGVSDRDSAVRLVVEASQTPWGNSLGGFPSLPTNRPPSSGTWLSRLPWPWPTRWRPENDHSFAAKLALVFALAITMMLAAAAYIAAVVMIDGVASGRHPQGALRHGDDDERQDPQHVEQRQAAGGALDR